MTEFDEQPPTQAPPPLEYASPVHDPLRPLGNMPPVAQVFLGFIAYVLAAAAGLWCLRSDNAPGLIATLLAFPVLVLWVHTQWHWRSLVFGVLSGLILSFLLVGVRLFR